MAGIYIHIPFCRKACNYCNFHFSTNTRLKDEFIDALLKETELQKHYINGAVESIYLGGGTPSILSADEVKTILQKQYEIFDIKENAEITIEANPDDITNEKLKEWKAAGINRLSIGIQSFFEEDLAWMNRAHNAEQALQCVPMAQEAGFENITIDLIYGSPSLTDENWKANVQKAIALNIPHLSCYALTVEPKTALEKLINTKKLAPVDPEKQARHFEQLIEWTNAAGYEQYEISNFAKPGNRSRHNSSYWQGKSYLGLGPSAHSFTGSSRQWNIANNALYIKSLQSGMLHFEIEHLTPDQQFNEYIMTGLRTMEGVSLQKIRADFGKEKSEYLLNAAQPHLAKYHLELAGEMLKTTNAGKLLADGIASDLFIL